MRVDSQPLSKRIALALALWAGFYLLAFGVVAGLLYFALLAVRTDDSGPLGWLAAGVAVFTAGHIFISCLPRWERFKPPGPRLDPADHPALFDEIRRVARDCRQKPPHQVYLTLDVNASVWDRGLFRRRILTLGLPLMQSVTVSQLRAILAHEFGHFVAGDTRFSPWIYRTHAALARTLVALEGRDSVWRFPFMAYANLFLKVTREVSRRQELGADALAARVAGARAAAEALKRIHRSGAAFPAYAMEEVFPLLDARRRPPLVAGFAEFMASPLCARVLARRMSFDLTDRRSDPRDSHPPLAVRLDALQAFTAGAEPAADPPAIGLLNDLDGVEGKVLADATGKPAVANLKRIEWAKAGEEALLPAWREELKGAGHHLAGITPATMLETDLTKLGRRIDVRLKDAEARSAAIRVLGLAFIVTLNDRGWGVTAKPGERPAAVLGDQRVETFHVFLDFAEGELTRAGWKERCAAGGFGDADLGFSAPSPTRED